MARRTESGFLKTSASSLREQAARTTLRNVRMQGHPYVELREDGKRFIFFCTLCLAPCYSESVLYDHLKGNLHSERYAAAKVTLLKSHPWPFNDGVLFFDNSSENDKHLSIANGNPTRLLGTHKNDNNLAIVCHGDDLSQSNNRHVEQHSNKNSDCDVSFYNESLNNGGRNCDMMIPGVMIKDEVTELEVRFLGFGQIAARFFEKDGVSKGISKIWCEWFGKEEPGDGETVMVPDHDFAVVTFNYHYNLGRKGLFDDVISMLSSSPTEGSGRKRKKSFSDPEDISESLSNQYDSSGEDSLISNSPSPRLLLDRYDDQLLDTRFISSKTIRRELRRQQRVAAERMCDICQHKMLPGKDVATLMNMKTGKLVCSSRNVYGAFHVFHTSCLIHWILLCEFEIFTNQLVCPKLRRSSRRKSGSKCNGKGKDGVIKPTTLQICSVFCPECQGTGIMIEDELEIPNIPLSEMFKYKIKVSDAHRAWMKNPEELKHCSTGFNFPSQSGETVQEKVSSLKLLHFYSADE